jgi:histidine triad (HIT) family protein
MSDSIFTKIIKGEIPCHKIYEDERTFAFLDISPAAEGHTLVIPKTEVEFVWDLPEEDYMALMNTVKKVALRLREVTGKPYIGEMVVGTDVPHAHVHLVPFSTAPELKRAAEGDREKAEDTALAEIAEKFAF